ncbi:unnamed protein product, partial [Musa textilis]
DGRATKPHLNPNLNLAGDGVRRAVVRVAARSRPGERHSPTKLCADHGLADAARRPVPCEEESHGVSSQSFGQTKEGEGFSTRREESCNSSNCIAQGSRPNKFDLAFACSNPNQMTITT